MNENTTTVKKDPWYMKFFRWFCGGAKKLFQIAMANANEQITYVLNDQENQALAMKAIEAATAKGLKGREAFDAAMAVMKAGNINTSPSSCMLAEAIPSNVLQTLVQLVYTCIKTKLKQ